MVGERSTPVDPGSGFGLSQREAIRRLTIWNFVV